MKEDKLRLEIIEYGKALVENKLIQATWGNISARLDNEYFLITPSGVDYFKLEPKDIVKVKIDDFSYEGNIKPSSEKNLHGLIYKNRNDIGTIIHTHSTCIQTFAACRESLILAGKIIYPCSKYGVSGSNKLAKNVAYAMNGYNGVIIANHGFVYGSSNLKECLDGCIEAENLARDVIGGK